MPVVGRYKQAYTRSLADPEGFWLEAAELIDWTAPPSVALDASNPPFYRWYPDGERNTCVNALDRHVERGLGDRTALIWDSAMVPAAKSSSYRELRDEVARIAGALAGLGVGKGDRVVIYMPMVPEAVMTMLACARIGAVHSVVFGGFAPKELGPVASFHDVTIVGALPKTRSGKILRKTMRGIAEGKDEPIPATIEDASVLDALTPILRNRAED